MKKGATPTILFFLVVVLIIGIVIFSPKLNSSGKSLSEVTGGTTSNVICPTSSSTCSSPDGSIACEGTLKGCLNDGDRKYYEVPNSANKKVNVALTYSGTGCNVNDLYIYDSSCKILYVSSDNLWTKTWTGIPSTDVIVGIDGDSSNNNCQWDLSITCL